MLRATAVAHLQRAVHRHRQRTLRWQALRQLIQQRCNQPTAKDQSRFYTIDAATVELQPSVVWHYLGRGSQGSERQVSGSRSGLSPLASLRGRAAAFAFAFFHTGWA